MNIQDKLQQHWEFLAEKNDTDRLLGIFLYGSQNYGLSDAQSDVDSVAIYLPSFEEMCLRKDWLSIEYHLENGEHIVLKDIREMRLMWQKQNINFMEILFTPYKIVNPLYESIFEENFIKHNEDIAHYDEQKAVKSIGCQAINNFKSKGEKDFYNGCRLYYFLKQYTGRQPYESCMRPDDITAAYLQNIKHGSGLSEEDENAQSEKYIEQINILMENFVPHNADGAASYLDTGVVALLHAAQVQDRQVTKEEFLAKLTTTEQKALSAIYTTVGAEGNFSVSNIVQEFGISRPVFTTLINKMREAGVAQTVSQGVKGTYIKFLQKDLRADAAAAKKGE